MKIPKSVTTKDAAQQLGVSEQRVRTLLRATTSKNRDHAIGLDFSDHMVAPIDNESPTHRIDSNPFGMIKTGVGAVAVEIAETAERTGDKLQPRHIECEAESGGYHASWMRK